MAEREPTQEDVIIGILRDISANIKRIADTVDGTPDRIGVASAILQLKPSPWKYR